MWRVFVWYQSLASALQATRSMRNSAVRTCASYALTIVLGQHSSTSPRRARCKPSLYSHNFTITNYVCTYCAPCMVTSGSRSFHLRNVQHGHYTCLESRTSNSAHTRQLISNIDIAVLTDPSLLVDLLRIHEVPISLPDTSTERTSRLSSLGLRPHTKAFAMYVLTAGGTAPHN